METVISTSDALPGGEPLDTREATRETNPRRRYLFNRWVDFLALGGGSIIVMGGMAAFFPKDVEAQAVLAATMLVLAHFVNHPHFAHSYQLFYTGFVRKAFSSESTIRHRYRFAGIMIPTVLAVYLVSTLALGSAPLLGLAANVMFLMVGWHYAKQGFGILMLDAVRKGAPFSPREKRHLLWNTHLTWPTYWLMTNNALAARDYWGLTYYLFDVPDVFLITMCVLSAASAIVVGRDLLLKWRVDRALPVNGLIAYVASVYIWLLIGRLDPVLFLVVPLFHSLQYLCVVWRYQLNVEADEPRKRPAGGGAWASWLRTAPAGLARFALIGGLLGATGFWFAPNFLNTFADYDRAVFGTTVFLFIAWTFINIHHYFIDAVIWRRENPETRRYLFAA